MAQVLRRAGPESELDLGRDDRFGYIPDTIGVAGIRNHKSPHPHPELCHFSNMGIRKRIEKAVAIGGTEPSGSSSHDLQGAPHLLVKFGFGRLVV